MSICLGGVSVNNNRVEIVGVFVREMVCLFYSQTFSCINTPTISTQLLFVLTPPMQMEQTECSETLAYKIQTAGKHPKVRIHHLSLLKFPIYGGPSKVEQFDSRTTWNSNKKFEKNLVWNSNKNSKVEPWARHCTALCGSCHFNSKVEQIESWTASWNGLHSTFEGPLYLQCLLNLLTVIPIWSLLFYFCVVRNLFRVIGFCNSAQEMPNLTFCCVRLGHGFTIKLQWRLQKPHFLDFLW
jgi:hypothetical protein